MAKPINPLHIEHEARLAQLSLAGVRPMEQSVVSVSASASSEQTYTIEDPATRRAIVVHLAANDDDIRFELNSTADSSSFPLLSSVYFGVQVEQGDVLHFFNTSGSPVTIYIMETR